MTTSPRNATGRADRGYFMMVPVDCRSTMNAGWQRASTEYAVRNVAAVTTLAEVLAALGH